MGRGEPKRGCSARGAPADRGGLREALETLVSERSVFFRAVARSQGGGFQGGGILNEVAAGAERGGLREALEPLWFQAERFPVERKRGGSIERSE